MVWATGFLETGMKRLWLKFLILLLIIGGVALSGTVALRYLMLGDFRAYLEGETEDRIYGILADLEAAYEQQPGWDAKSQGRDALWALTGGFEIRLLDEDGKTVIDSAKMLQQASPLVTGRLKALSQLKAIASDGQFIPYPLFLRGRQIGTLEVRELRQARGGVFARRSDSFLLWCIVIVGGVALLLSLFFSQRLTRPIKELAFAASDISEGNLQRQVQTSRRDEVGDLAKAFNRMAKSLKAQESLRRKLIADVAHELRTPLGVMRGELEALIDGLIPNDAARLQSLHDETGRLKQIVDGIEDLNQAEASGLSLKLEAIKIKPFLDNIIERFLPLFWERKIGLELSCDDNAELEADPERLSQVILNLISNALKATEEGGKVSVSVVLAKDEWAIAVEDDGSGIREGDLPYVFERFYKGPDGGLGIGLTIVKELVEAHGGRIEVNSAQGKGSLFTVLLPSRSIHNSS
jgi:two-component system, OmpR family, sensor histidine kinase BaeS